jgi:hypothetical protein
MSVRITSQESKVALFDSTTGAAFGVVFDSEADAEDFLGAFGYGLEGGIDPSRITNDEFVRLYNEWLQQKLMDEADGEEIMHGYMVGHYSPEHIARYGSPS